MKKYLYKKKTRCFVLILSFCLITFHISFAQSIKSSNISLHNKLLYIKGNNIWVSEPDGREGQKITKTGDISNFTISNDLSKIVLVRNDKKLHIIDIDTGTEKYIAEVETDMSAPAISPSNDRILIASNSKRKFKIFKDFDTVRHVWLFDLRKGNSIELNEKDSESCTAPQWSPDGSQISLSCMSISILRSILQGGGGWHVYVMRTSDNMENKKREIVSGFYSIWIDSQTLLISSEKGDGIIFYNLEKGAVTKKIKFNPGSSPFQFSFGPPNKFFYEDSTKNPDSDIGLLDLKTLKRKIIIEDGSSPIYCK